MNDATTLPNAEDDSLFKSSRNVIQTIIDNVTEIEGLWVLGWQELTDNLLEKICLKQKHLRCLNLTSCCQITNHGFKSVLKHCKHLKRLDAKMLIKLSDECVKDTDNQNLIEYLDLGYSMLTDVGFNGIITDTCSNSLQKLDLGFCRNLSDKGIEIISLSLIHI